MSVSRFVGKNAREAMAQVRAAWGDDAVVLANRPIAGGVEILAMPGADMAGPARRAPSRTLPAAAPVAPMSTVSFQEFVRERQRLQEQQAEPEADPGFAAAPLHAPMPMPAAAVARAQVPRLPDEPGLFAAHALRDEMARAQPVREAHPLGEELMAEMKAMRGMITHQLASFSWFDAVRRSPAQTQLLRLMLGNGFSATLARQLVHRLPADRAAGQAGNWLMDVLARNLRCVDTDSITEQGGVYALVGPTGVGKTTTTAKIAANFALRHGAASVGLITVDTYRMAASDQLRAFGRILNIPVHTARDATSLADFLNLFARKKLVLIDTVGVGQRDRRLAELFAALPGDRVSRLLVLSANAQAETLEEVVSAYGAQPGSRCVITKLDEAARCGAVIDVAIRHQLLVEGFANGQRVPEDWHAARAQLLVQKALLKQPDTAFTHDDDELGLMVTAPEASVGAAGPGTEAPRV